MTWKEKTDYLIYSLMGVLLALLSWGSFFAITWLIILRAPEMHWEWWLGWLLFSLLSYACLYGFAESYKQIKAEHERS